MDRVGYRAIADDLRAEIDAGNLPPGSKVPGENELMATYGVEQPTARRALDVLKNEGLIVARRGAGTFVREFRLYRRRSPARLAESGWGTGSSIWQSDDIERQTSVDSIEIAATNAPDHVAGVLGLANGDKALVRRRRYLVDDVPVQLATSYYPAQLVGGSAVAEADTGPGGVYARLAELGHRPVNFREELRVRMPRDSEAKLLELAQGTPVILVARTAFTAQGRAAEVNEMILDSSSYMAYCCRRAAAFARGEDPGEWLPLRRRRPDLDLEGRTLMTDIVAQGTTGSASSKMAPASSAL